MTEIKINIPDDLEKKMKEHPEINWTSVVSKIFEKFLLGLDPYKEPITIQELEKLAEFSLKEFLEDEPDYYDFDRDSRNVKIEKSDLYKKFVKSDDLAKKFEELLKKFLYNHFKRDERKPIKIYFDIFIFPGEDYKEPIINIIYPDINDLNNLEIRDGIERSFKQFLAEKSEDLDEFKAFRVIQKKIRFVIQRA